MAEPNPKSPQQAASVHLKALDLRALAARVARAVLAERGVESKLPRGQGVHLSLKQPRPTPGPAAQGSSPAPLIDGAAVEAARASGVLHLPQGAEITPLAREEATLAHLALHGPGAAAMTSGSLRVAIGADHGGFALKQHLGNVLARWGHRVLDLGTHSRETCDYPDFALAVAEAVRGGQAQLGVVVDGAGLGSAMAANKVPGVRAAPCPTVELARNARAHNHANVLTLGAAHLGPEAAEEVLRAFLTTPPGEERHRRRVAKITAIETRHGRGAPLE